MRQHVIWVTQVHTHADAQTLQDNRTCFLPVDGQQLIHNEWQVYLSWRWKESLEPGEIARFLTPAALGGLSYWGGPRFPAGAAWLQPFVHGRVAPGEEEMWGGNTARYDRWWFDLDLRRDTVLQSHFYTSSSVCGQARLCVSLVLKKFKSMPIDINLHVTIAAQIQSMSPVYLWPAPSFDCSVLGESTNSVHTFII